MSLLIVGTVAFDGIETPRGKVDKILGGSATYISIISSYFNTSTNLISVVGGDFPKKYIELFEKYGINCQGLEIKKNEKTFYWSGRYHENMKSRDTIVTELNVLEKFNPKIPEPFQDCKHLMLANLMPSIQLDAISKLKERPKLIVTDTMNFWIENCLDDLKKVISMTDVLIINDEEALQLSNKSSISDASSIILEMGPRFLIIKRGESGATLFKKDNQFDCCSFTVKSCIDPTGAGDSFAGAFVGYLNSTDDMSFENMKKAVTLACTFASFTVEGFGIDKILNINNHSIEERLKEIQTKNNSSK